MKTYSRMDCSLYKDAFITGTIAESDVHAMHV